MIKKILIGVLFLGVAGLLVWGGVNRTLAKPGEPLDYNRTENNQNYRALEEQGHNDQWEQENQTYDSEGFEQNRKGRYSESDHDEYREPSIQSMDGDETSEGYRGGSSGQGNGGQGRGGGREPLTESDVQALNLALQDEYRALATYLSVIDAFGNVEPFASIALSEQRHINALINQFNKYGIPVPENTWLGNIDPFESVQQACQAGVQAEIANADLYTTLFSMTEKADLVRMFTNLSQASIESHLPEFEACE